MGYIKTGLKTFWEFLRYSSAFFLILNVVALDPLAFYFVYVALFCAIVGPLVERMGKVAK